MTCLTTGEVMKRLHISHATVLRMVRGGKFDGVVFRPAGLNEFRFDADALEARIMEWKKQSAKVA